MSDSRSPGWSVPPATSNWHVAQTSIHPRCVLGRSTARCPSLCPRSFLLGWGCLLEKCHLCKVQMSCGKSPDLAVTTADRLCEDILLNSRQNIIGFLCVHFALFPGVPLAEAEHFSLLTYQKSNISRSETQPPPTPAHGVGSDSSRCFLPGVCHWDGSGDVGSAEANQHCVGACIWGNAAALPQPWGWEGMPRARRHLRCAQLKPSSRICQSRRNSALTWPSNGTELCVVGGAAAAPAPANPRLVLRVNSCWFLPLGRAGRADPAGRPCSLPALCPDRAFLPSPCSICRAEPELPAALTLRLCVPTSTEKITLFQSLIKTGEWDPGGCLTPATLPLCLLGP